MSPYAFSQTELDTIHQHPITDDRAIIREELQKLSESFTDFASLVQTSTSNRTVSRFFFMAISTLAGAAVAEELIDHNTCQSLQNSLLHFLINWPAIISVEAALVQPCATLIERVVSDSSDITVWTAVYGLLSLVSRPATPPAVRTAKSGTFDTPPRPNSGSRMTESQTHILVDPFLRAELRGTVFKDVSGFHTFFSRIEEAEWNCAFTCENDCSCEARWDWDNHGLQASATVDPWPDNPTEDAALRWFSDFNRYLDVPGPTGLTRFYSSKDKPLDDSPCLRQCDIFVSQMLTEGHGSDSEIKPDSKHRFSWYHALVPGELKSNPSLDCHPNTVTQLAAYVREIFGSQVGRRFVHAFTICGDIMRCYLFDRAGVSISKAFHICKNERTFKLFVRILLCYSTMRPEEFGFDSNYTTANGEPYLPTKSFPMPAYVIFSEHQFQLVKRLFYQPAIVSRGTLCWLAKDESGKQCVVKDAWRSAYRRSEGSLLEIAKAREVWGAVDCRFHGDVKIKREPDVISSNVRKGLDYNDAKEVSISERIPDGMHCLGTSRGTDAGLDRANRLKLQRYTGSSSTAKRKLPGQGLRNSKRAKIADRPDGEAADDGGEDDEDIDGDRIHTFLVSYTVGKDICRFTSVSELLEAFRDAIKCHRSLWEKGKILHRDVSINNIMISIDTAENGPRGFLIDLDLAKLLDSTPSGAPHRTGTMEFMAIEVLEGTAAHSWRHDLESFFYILVWICVLHDGTGKARAKTKASGPWANILDAWSSKQASDNKYRNMTSPETFEIILRCFDEDFKGLRGLLRGWRKTLFSKGREAFIGTHEDPKRVYDSMVGALQKQIAQLPR